MREDDQISRYEINRSVRIVFTRHDADLTKIEYSCMGNTVYLYGDLVKPDGDFSAQEIETIVKEISALPHVRDMQFDLNNWTLASSGNSWLVTRTSKAAATTGVKPAAGSFGDSTVTIENAEELEAVLDDLQSKSKKEE